MTRTAAWTFVYICIGDMQASSDSVLQCLHQSDIDRQKCISHLRSAILLASCWILRECSNVLQRSLLVPSAILREGMYVSHVNRALQWLKLAVWLCKGTGMCFNAAAEYCQLLAS